MNKERYYRCEYENLRRRKNKEIERMKLQQSIFAHKTYDLLIALGMTYEDIERYYKDDIHRQDNY